MSTTNHNHTAAGEGFTLREVNGLSVCQHQGADSVVVVESGIYPASSEAGLSNVGPANEVQPFNGKQNILEHETIDEKTDQDIYDGESHEPTTFSLGVETLTIVLGDSHKFTVTPSPITANLPNLVWNCSQDTNEETSEKFDVCFVNDGILRTLNVGTSTVTAYDLTNPDDIKSKSVTVNVVKTITTDASDDE